MMKRGKESLLKSFPQYDIPCTKIEGMELICEKGKTKNTNSGLEHIFMETILLPTLFQPTKVSEKIVRRALHKIEYKIQLSAIDVMRLPNLLIVCKVLDKYPVQRIIKLPKLKLFGKIRPIFLNFHGKFN